MVCGDSAGQFAELMQGSSMPIEVLTADTGTAATRKLLRSVMMKGLAALLIEAMRAGRAAGEGDWLWKNMVSQLTIADEALMTRLVQGSKTHAWRRLHEMEAAETLLGELEIDPVMTRSTVTSLRRLLNEELPDL